MRKTMVWALVPQQSETKSNLNNSNITHSFQDPSSGPLEQNPGVGSAVSFNRSSSSFLIEAKVWGPLRWTNGKADSVPRVMVEWRAPSGAELQRVTKPSIIKSKFNAMFVKIKISPVFLRWTPFSVRTSCLFQESRILCNEGCCQSASGFPGPLRLLYPSAGRLMTLTKASKKTL